MTSKRRVDQLSDAYADGTRFTPDELVRMYSDYCVITLERFHDPMSFEDFADTTIEIGEGGFSNETLR